MTRDEAVQAIEKVLDVQGGIDPLGRRRALALFIFDAIGFDQMQARIADNTLMAQHNADLMRELGKVRADVLKLRDAIIEDGHHATADVEIALTDTEHYEQFRKTS